MCSRLEDHGKRMLRERPGFDPSLCHSQCGRAEQKVKQAVLSVGSASLCFLHGDAAGHPSAGTEGSGAPALAWPGGCISSLQ